MGDKSPPPLDDATTNHLVALFKAPAAKHHLIAKCLRTVHRGAWKWGKDWRSPTVVTALQFREATRVWIKSYRALPPRTREEIETGYPLIDCYLEGFANHIDEEMGKRRPKFGPQRPDWTRFDSLAVLMLWIARDTGGTLSFNEKDGTGSLNDLLTEFRRYLPRGFVPNELPRKRLATIKKDFRKNRR